MINKHTSIIIAVFIISFVLSMDLPPTNGNFFYSDLRSGDEYGTVFIEAMYG